MDSESVTLCVLTKRQVMYVDLGGRGVYDVDLKPLDCWDRGFESRRGIDVRLLYCVGRETSATG
jgi:hypothetical protein